MIVEPVSPFCPINQVIATDRTIPNDKFDSNMKVCPLLFCDQNMCSFWFRKCFQNPQRWHKPWQIDLATVMSRAAEEMQNWQIDKLRFSKQRKFQRNSGIGYWVTDCGCAVERLDFIIIMMTMMKSLAIIAKNGVISKRWPERFIWIGGSAEIPT